MELEKETRELHKRLESGPQVAEGTPAGGPAGNSEAPASSEAQLALQLRIIQSELEYWQTAAAGNAAHVRTYKALSLAADEEVDNQRNLLVAEKEAAAKAAQEADRQVQDLQVPV